MKRDVSLLDGKLCYFFLKQQCNIWHRKWGHSPCHFTKVNSLELPFWVWLHSHLAEALDHHPLRRPSPNLSNEFTQTSNDWVDQTDKRSIDVLFISVQFNDLISSKTNARKKPQIQKSNHLTFQHCLDGYWLFSDFYIDFKQFAIRTLQFYSWHLKNKKCISHHNYKIRQNIWKSIFGVAERSTV